jgi:hypothetical protein
MSRDGILQAEITMMDEMGFNSRDFLCCYGWAELGMRFETCKQLGWGRRYDVLIAMSTDGLVSAPPDCASGIQLAVPHLIVPLAYIYLVVCQRHNQVGQFR